MPDGLAGFGFKAKEGVPEHDEAGIVVVLTVVVDVVLTVVPVNGATVNTYFELLNPLTQA